MRSKLALITTGMAIFAAPIFAQESQTSAPLPPVVSDALLAFAFDASGTDSAVGSPPPPPLPPRVIIRRAGEGPAEMWSMGDFDGDDFANPRMLERMADELGLTPQQRGKLTEHMATHRPEMRKLREDMQKARQALREVNPTDAKYDATVAATAKQVGDLSAKMVKESAVLRAKVWGELTVEQRAKLAENAGRREQRAQEMRKRMSERSGSGDGRRIREIRLERLHRN